MSWRRRQKRIVDRARDTKTADARVIELRAQGYRVKVIETARGRVILRSTKPGY